MSEEVIRPVGVILAELDAVLQSEPAELRRKVIAWSADLMKAWQETAPESNPTAGLDPDAANDAARKIGVKLEIMPNPRLPLGPESREGFESWLLEKLVNVLYAPSTWHEFFAVSLWYYLETARDYLSN